MSAAQRIALVVALLVLAGSAGYAVGTRTGSDDPPDARSADVGFLWDMIAHHEQALVMSQYQVAAGTEPRVTHFAREILQAQSYEIGLMQAYLERWGQPRGRPDERAAMGWMGHAMPVSEMPGMATETAMERLADANGRDVDALFISMMKEHHRGGADMADAAVTRVRDDAVRALATRVAKYQRVEINELEATRTALGLPEP